MERSGSSGTWGAPGVDDLPGFDDGSRLDDDLTEWLHEFRGPGGDVELAVVQAEHYAAEEARAAAAKLRSVHSAVSLARSAPELFVAPGCGRGREAVEFAERAVVAELAAALGASFHEVRGQAALAELLVTSLPLLWKRFEAGEVTSPAVRSVAQAVRPLVSDSDAMAAFDAAVAEAATTMTRAQLCRWARRRVERLAAQTREQRHVAARAERRVWIDDVGDGMSELHAVLPADAAHRAWARVDANARRLATAGDERRTLARLRCDVLSDLLTGDGTEHRVRATVHVQIPVGDLLPGAHGDARADDVRRDPSLLDGTTPIDPETARRLCADAPSLYRLFTDPVDGAVLTVGRASYRPPAELARLVRARHPRCAFPGCSRAASDCDLDHVEPWAGGGETAVGNLVPLCRRDHRLKHRTRWKARYDPTRAGRAGPPEHRGQPTAAVIWTSPLGSEHPGDPPF